MSKLLKYFLSIIRFLAIYIGIPAFLLIFIVILMASFHIMQKVPHIKGTLIKDGKPISEISVKYILVSCGKNRDSISIESETKTSKDGKFEIVGKRHPKFIVPLPADYIICWRLCFQEPGKESKCWEVEAFGPPHPPEYFELECDLNSRDVCKVINTSDRYFLNRLQEE